MALFVTLACNRHGSVTNKVAPYSNTFAPYPNIFAPHPNIFAPLAVVLKKFVVMYPLLKRSRCL